MLHRSYDKMPENYDLPPGCNNNQIQYTLTLSFNSVHLLELSPRPVMIKLHMWGLQNQNRIHQDSKLSYNIRTNVVLFRDYLRDMKVTVIKLCDMRNDQQLGTAVINWVVYMRKVDLKSTPFMEDSFDISLPVVNYKKKQIAEVKFLVQWAVYHKIQQVQRQQDAQSDYFNRKETYRTINQIERQRQIKKRNKVSSLSKLQNQKQQEQSIIQHQSPTNILNKNSVSYKNARKQSNFATNLRKSQHQNQKTDKQIRYPDSKYQLQRTKLKLQADQFITLTRKQNLKGADMLENYFTIKISELVTSKPNIIVQYMDIYIISKKQGQIFKKNMRIFPLNSKQPNNFIAEISIKDKDSLQIELAKGLGKATTQSKTIKQKNTIKLFIYGKTGKIGTIMVTKISQSSNNARNQKNITSIQQQYAQKTIQPNKIQKNMKSNISQQNSAVLIRKNQPPLPTSNTNPIYFLISIQEVKHYQYGQFDVAVKNYTFSKPYPSFNIIPLSDLGTIFAIEFRSNTNQTIDSTFIENYTKIPIVQQSLGCVVLTNGRIDLQRGYIRTQIMMGTMRQINYQLAKQNKNRNNVQTIQYMQAPKNPQRKRRITSRQKDYQNQNQNYDIELKMNRQENPININMKSKQQSIQSSKIKQQLDIVGPIKKRRSNRKMYSEFLVTEQNRIATEPNYKYDNQLIDQEEKQQNQQDNIWLVQILSKFLHALPADKFSQTPPTNVEEFINLLLHFLANRDQKQLIQLVIDMFIDDISIQQGQPQKLQYEQFLKCLKSYHNFLQLWNRMRVDILSEVIKLQPDYTNKITQYSQLGTISKQFLWRKALIKIDNAQLKMKIDKILKLNTGTSISSQYIIDQLKRVQFSPNEIQRQATPDLIVDLGKLIKQTMESILEGSGIVPPTVVEDRVNIRILCDIFQKINISLSYWEALMLIQELKGWYNVDIDLNQGIVSGSVVQVWIKSVLNRSKHSSQIGGISPAQTVHKENNSAFRQPIPTKIQLRKQQQKLQRGLQQIPSQKIGTNRISENKSVVKSELNQQEIFNIANLLRDNDNFRLGTMSSEKPPSRLFNNNNISNQNVTQNQLGRGNNMSKILNDQILNQSRQESHPTEHQQAIQARKKTQNLIIKQQQNIDKSPRYILTKIKSTKLKKQLALPIKISMKVYNNKEHYFLIKSMEELQGRQFVEQLTYNWHRQSKGLSVQLIKIQQNQNQNKYRQKAEVLLYGILLNDQILDLYKKQSIPKTKTIVLYGNKQILGKITLQVQILNKKPQIFYIQKKIKIQLEILPDIAHDKQWNTFLIKTTSIANIPSTKHQLQHSQQSITNNIQVKKCTRHAFQMNGTFYKQLLVVTVEGVGNCTVPLEQLYFKNQIIGEYPVINSQGLYLGNLQIKLYNPNNITHNKTQNMNMTAIQKQPQVEQLHSTSTSTQKYLVIFDSITTLCNPLPHNPIEILSNIFVKDAISRNILYRSQYYIEYQHPRQQAIHHSFISEFSADNYCIVEDGRGKNKTITIQLEYEGRHIGVSDMVIKLKDFAFEDAFTLNKNKTGCRVCYQLKWTGNSNSKVQLRMGVRVIPIPSSFQKYNVKRIYKAICKYKYDQQQTTSDVGKQIQRIVEDNQKLTITQQRLLKQIVQLSIGVIYVNYGMPMQKYYQLIEQLIFSDNKSTGKLSHQQISQIIQTLSCRHIYQSYLTTHSQNKTQLIDYISLLQYVFKIDHIAMNMSLVNNEGQLNRQVISNVDKIYEEIKRKYAAS